ncbi:MAG TPA: DUF547 domain-containing protein [Thermoanaerobaculia bacterium]|nr:DUF547 domain-containing protein [Thermoanaerobaculia bacterium]
MTTAIPDRFLNPQLAGGRIVSSMMSLRHLFRPIVLILVSITVACSPRGGGEAPAIPKSDAATVKGEPDYSTWNRLLKDYYSPAQGMKYGPLKARDEQALRELRAKLGSVDVASLTKPQQLAYWINLYNVNVVGVVVDRYPVDSIKELSTDPVTRTNVFRKPLVPFAGNVISLDDIENDKIRMVFADPRIHFAINCAAASCPPIRPEAFVGDHVDAQLDEQVRTFASGPLVRVERNGSKATMHTSSIMKWFADDFAAAGGGVTFLAKYLPAEKKRVLDEAGGKAELEYDDYSWKLNDWK